jgi:hypothetical protein
MPSGFKIAMLRFSTATLTDCTFSGNTAGNTGGTAHGGGALWIYLTNVNVLFKGCSFVGPISDNHNDIAYEHWGGGETNAVTFACADGESGAPVKMQGYEIAVIPPKELKCTAQTYACYNGGKANWKCVPDPTSTATLAQCHEVCAP